MRRRTLIRLASASAIVGPTTARAQAYPTKPLTIVAPYSPGGPTDTLSRILAEHMQPVLGQTILIENVTGAGGAQGVTRVARAAPDGYTISTGNPGSHITVWALQPTPFDLAKDLAPVALFATNPQIWWRATTSSRRPCATSSPGSRPIPARRPWAAAGWAASRISARSISSN